MDDRLLAWVGEVAGGPVLDAKPRFAGGSRALWFLEVDRAGETVPLVLRHETGEGAFADTELSLQREAVVYRALRGTGVPTAGLDGVAPGGEAMLLERLPGDSRLADRGHDEVASIVESFFCAMGVLHGIEPEHLALPGFFCPTTPEGHALDELALWNRLADRYLPHPAPLIAYARSWLAHHAPRRVQRTVLTQGDTGPGNFLHDRGRVTGLVDWELAHLGDPMDDVAWIDLRSSGGPPPFDDVETRDRLYEQVTGLRVDPVAVEYHAVMVRLRCAITTGMAISRGSGAVGLNAYFAPHHRFLVDLGWALAAALELEPTLLEIPDGDDTDRTARYDHAIDGLRSEVLPGLAGSLARLRARSALILLEHERSVDLLGPALEHAEASDRASTLGSSVSDDELAALARDAGKSGDRTVLDLLTRGAQRAGRPWFTPAVGGVTAPTLPPRR